MPKQCYSLIKMKYSYIKGFLSDERVIIHYSDENKSDANPSHYFFPKGSLYTIGLK